MGQYDKIRATIRALEKEIKELQEQRDELAYSIALRMQQKGELISYLKELDAMDNTDPEHRGEEVYW